MLLRRTYNIDVFASPKAKPYHPQMTMICRSRNKVVNSSKIRHPVICLGSLDAVSTIHDIDPVFFHVYVENVCKSSEQIRQCIASLYMPPIEKQLHIMDILRQTMDVIDISDILGSAMSLLIKDDMEKYKELVKAYAEHQLQLEHIQDIVKHALPLKTNIINV